MLNVNNLTVTIGKKKLLDNISFHVPQNSTLAVIGDSGSGKTFTAHSIIQLLPEEARISQHSSIVFDKTDLLTLNEVQLQKIRGNKIGMIFQEPMTALNPVLTIGDQISEVLHQHTDLSTSAIKQKVIQLLHEVGFENAAHLYHAYPHQLSGGMRQRVVIAIAIAAEPELLIADEPTSALDVTTQAQIIALIKKLQIKRQMAMLFITHDLHVAQQVADQVAVVKKGKITELKNAADFFNINNQPELITPIQEDISTNPIMTIKDLCVYFPIQKGLLKRTVGYVKAVDHVSLQLYPQKTLAIVGESGSGKTTLAKAILQLVKPTSGVVTYQDFVINTHLHANQLKKLHHEVQIIFQDPFSSLNPRMLVLDLISEGLVAQGLMKSDREIEKRVDELLKLVDLPLDCKYRYPHEFSGGQRQRIVIARALAVNPKVLICDEPTSALDVHNQEQIVQLLLRLQKELGLSYLFITHNIPLAASIAHEIAVMRHGKIIEYAATEQVINNPQQEYTKELLRAAGVK
jgi:peptide/nickel transport system ATP-binding protein